LLEPRNHWFDKTTCNGWKELRVIYLDKLNGILYSDGVSCDIIPTDSAASFTITDK
jgi:hypothetical protein